MANTITISISVKPLHFLEMSGCIKIFFNIIFLTTEIKSTLTLILNNGTVNRLTNYPTKMRKF